MTWHDIGALFAPRPWRRVLLAALIGSGSLTGLAHVASADVTTIKVDPTRQGWRGDEASLKPPLAEQFDTPVSGQVYGQPLVFGNTVVVATQNDLIYGINRTTGAVIWRNSVGTPEPSSVINCQDVTPSYGVTSTPVIDPASGTVYLTARTWDGSNASSARWRAFAFDATTGALKSGWPITITGTATNDPSSSFDPTVENQRTGLLLMGGRLFAGFGGMCDLGAYKGWIASIDASARSVSMWVDEKGNNVAAGIWHSGGGLASDGTSVFAATGNGSIPTIGPGTTAQAALGMSSLRLTVDGSGHLNQADRFTPSNALSLSNSDLDMGSGGPTVLPDGFGAVANHPHLLVQPSKTSLYLLDRDNLGGMAQGANGTDNVVSEMANQAAWSHAAIWPGDGGYFYMADVTPTACECAGPMKAYRVGPTGALSVAGTSNEQFGWPSGPPIITSNGTTPGSATLWVIDKGTNQLMAYNPVPVNGTLQLLFRTPIGSAAKFSVPAADGNQVFVGTQGGHLLAYTPAPTGCQTFSSPGTGSHSVCGAILAKYQTLGGPAGVLGYPTTDETGTPDGIGRYNHFSSTANSNNVDGSIYWTPNTGAWSIHGGIRAKWASLGWERSVLGYPTTDETSTPDGIGRYNHFSFTDNLNNVDGSIYWTPNTGAWSIHGAIRAKWASLGWERSCLGYPVSDEFAIPGGRQNNLQHGVITYAFSTRQASSSC